MFIPLTVQERESRQLTPETLEIAAEQVRVNGFAAFEKVIDESLVANVKSSFDPLFDEYVTRKGFNTGTNRAQMHLPFAQPYIHEDIVAHPFAMAVIDKVLGADNRCTYLASDTPMPGSDYQSVHCDAMPMFPELAVPLPPFSLVVNIPLVDVTDENGPLEIWPGGTHLNPDQAVHDTLDGSVNPHLHIVRAASYMHAERIRMPAGSIIVRDIRMWHRGTPNRSQERRTNIALIFNRSWHGYGSTIQIPQDTYLGLPGRLQRLFRFERIGSPVRMPWEW